MRKLAKRLLGDQSGTTAIEYGLIAALLALAIVGVVAGLGQQVAALFTQISGAFG